MAKGFVYLVGAGPGRADLITVRGAEVLKEADCVICDKLAEELEVLAEAGIGFKIVPGVTASIAVSAYTGIMLTDRDYSSQVVLCYRLGSAQSLK